MPTIEELKKQVQRLELEEKLKKMGGVVSPKTKQKVHHHKEHTKTETGFKIEELKKEINDIQERKNIKLKELEEQKKGKGFFGKLKISAQKVGYSVGANKSMAERKGIIQRDNQLKNIRQQSKILDQQEQIFKQREAIKLRQKAITENRNKNVFDTNKIFDNSGIFGNENKPRKKIEFGDIFK